MLTFIKKASIRRENAIHYWPEEMNGIILFHYPISYDECKCSRFVSKFQFTASINLYPKSILDEPEKLL